MEINVLYAFSSLTVFHILSDQVQLGLGTVTCIMHTTNTPDSKMVPVYSTELALNTVNAVAVTQ